MGMRQDEDRFLAEDVTTPVNIEPGSDYATPSDWTWRSVSSSQPNAAQFHISHSESTRDLIDYLRPSASSHSIKRFPSLYWTVSISTGQQNLEHRCH